MEVGDVATILQQHIVYRRRLIHKQKIKMMHSPHFLTAAQFLGISSYDVLVSMDVEMLRAVYECFVGKAAPRKGKNVLATIVLTMQRELPQKVAMQERFCANVDRVMHTFRLPLVSGLSDAVKARHWYELIDRPVGTCCKVQVTDAHMMLVDLGAVGMLLAVTTLTRVYTQSLLTGHAPSSRKLSGLWLTTT
jgi:hypothetical protein